MTLKGLLLNKDKLETSMVGGMRKSCVFVIGLLLVLALVTLPTTKAQDIGVSYQIAWKRDISHIHTVDITPDGSRIVAGSYNILYLLDRDGNILWTKQDYELDGYIMGIAITPDGEYIPYATGIDVAGSRGTIGSLDKYGNEQWKYETKWGWALDVDTDGYIVFAIDEEGTLYNFDVYGNFYWEYSLDKNLEKISLGNNGSYVAVLWGNKEVCSVTPKNVDCDTTTSYNITALDVSPDGRYVVLGMEGYPGNWLLVESLPDGGDIYTKTLDTKISNVKFSPDSNYIAVVSSNKVYLYDINGNLLWQQELSENTYSVAVSQNAEYIVVSTGSSLYMFKKGEIKVNGTLEIYSTPSEAKVYINGEYKGVTPLSLKLELGTYTIKLTKKDYEDYTTTVTLSTGETKSISATLKPTYGYLTIDSSPSGAEVYVDGNYAGTTPLESYKLSPGGYEVKIIKEGYEEYSETVSIIAGETTTLSASLTPIPQSSSPTAIPTSTTLSQTTTTSTSAISSTTTASTTSTSETFTAPSGSKLNPLYIAGALIALLLIGGVAAKARGGKEKPPSRDTGKPAPALARKPEPEDRSKTISGFPPELLQKYEPLEFIGEGGFAKVFKVRRKSDGRIVALKIPRIDEKTSKTFIKEVSTWLHLNHPNIVKLYDVDILPIPYLEMEYVEGVTLNGKPIRDLSSYPKPVDEKTALRLIRGIAEGLKYAHGKGIYHRDLKPLNILLKSDLTPKITDWGLAKLGTMSSSRSVLGYTPLYASPEHLMPSKYGHTNHQTDIWQLGVTFYELLTGKLPFEGYTYEEVFGKIVDENYHFTPPSKINPTFAKYDSIFEKLLAKRKEDRYQNVDEFLKDLEKLEEIEKKRTELEREVEKLRETLSKSFQALKKSTTSEEVLKNKRLVIDTLGKLALAYAQLNKKADLLNTLNDLKFYTVQNLEDLTSAINTVELLIKENLPVSEEFIERLKVLIHNIKRENGA